MQPLQNYLKFFSIILLHLVCVYAKAEENWHQAAGPNGNWQVEGDPPTKWSVTRGENISWTTPMPEAGMSSVTVWADRLFVTTHVPIKSLAEQNTVKDIIGFCLDANTGKILWQVTLPGNAMIELAGGFTDGTVFAPITDGKHVWFFNRCGSMACYDYKGNRSWIREWTPRGKHTNRQTEPYLVADTIIYLEVANKEQGLKMQKWESPGVKSKNGTKIPEGIDPKEVWTYLHGIDKRTGKILWREKVGTSVHNTPVVGVTTSGKMAVAHARGGPHGTIEKPYGQSLTSLAPGEEGQTLWNLDLKQYDTSFSSHWNTKYVFGFQKDSHIVIDATSGKLLRKQPLDKGAKLWKFQPEKKDWVLQKDAVVKSKRPHPNTNQANIAVGDWHWFLCHDVHYIGRVNIETGIVEYLELPAQLIADPKSKVRDVKLWGKGNPNNKPLNANGFAVGNKGQKGIGSGHLSAASPTLIGRYLFIPVVTGTVYVIDTTVEQLSPKSLVAVNDLGPGGETWTLASLTYANGKIYAHTMKEIISIKVLSE